MPSESTDGKWEKVLWKAQPFSDNYVPPSFLSSLRKNANFRAYSYWPLVLACCSISQHLSSIFIFLATFINLLEGTWDPRLLIWFSICVYVVGFIVWEVLKSFEGLPKHLRAESRSKRARSSVIVFLALMAISPILRTLTAATSSDSIWALSAGLFLLNIVLADYGSTRPPGMTRERLTSVFSINAAISSSVVLASRLPDDTSVFALILFSVQAFALFPILRSRLQFTSYIFRALITVALSALALTLYASISIFITVTFGTISLFIVFGVPGVLMWAQQHKNEIRGPWDVAVPMVR